nr:hypothetical protein StreXyl84_06780 [Streptomyces sp. Xyl84]
MPSGDEHTARGREARDGESEGVQPWLGSAEAISCTAIVGSPRMLMVIAYKATGG